MSASGSTVNNASPLASRKARGKESQQQQQQQQQQQTEALRKLFHATGLNQQGSSLLSPYPINWNFTLSQRDPLDDPMYCNFTGVECGDSIVTALVLQKYHLSGSLPIELSQLTGLRRLGLGANRLHGEFPSMLLKEWIHLEHLELFRNDFHGPLPTVVPVLPISWPLPPLKRILVQHNDFAGTIPTDWCLLSNLHVLDLSNNHNVSGRLPECLGDIDSLHAVHIRGTSLTGTIPKGLCRKQEEFGCDAIACPVGTFESRWGRQSVAETPCKPCPGSQFLGATSCPVATESPSEPPTVASTTVAPSMIPTVIPSETPTPIPTSLSADPSSLSFVAFPSPEPSTVAWNYSIATSASPSPMSTADCNSASCDGFHLSGPPSFTPTQAPSSSALMLTETPTSSNPPTWSPDIRANSTSSAIADRLHDPKRQSANWILVIIAVLLSIVAMVAMIMARRMGRRRWYNKRQPQKDEFVVFVPEGADDSGDVRGFLSHHQRHLNLEAPQPHRDEDPELDGGMEIQVEVSTESESGWNDSESSPASSVYWHQERLQLYELPYQHTRADNEGEINLTWGGLYIPPLQLFAMDSRETGTTSSGYSCSSSESSVTSSSTITA